MRKRKNLFLLKINFHIDLQIWMELSHVSMYHSSYHRFTIPTQCPRWKMKEWDTLLLLQRCNIIHIVHVSKCQTTVGIKNQASNPNLLESFTGPSYMIKGWSLLITLNRRRYECAWSYIALNVVVNVVWCCVVLSIPLNKVIELMVMTSLPQSKKCLPIVLSWQSSDLSSR